jgi:hypothetical protein
LGRITAGRAIDPDYQPRLEPAGVSDLRETSEGRFLVAGRFRSINGVVKPYLAELDISGEVQPGDFRAPNSPVSALETDRFDRIYFAESIPAAGASGIARWGANNEVSPDPGFDFMQTFHRSGLFWVISGVRNGSFELGRFGSTWSRQDFSSDSFSAGRVNAPWTTSDGVLLVGGNELSTVAWGSSTILPYSSWGKRSLTIRDFEGESGGSILAAGGWNEPGRSFPLVRLFSDLELSSDFVVNGELGGSAVSVKRWGETIVVGGNRLRSESDGTIMGLAFLSAEAAPAPSTAPVTVTAFADSDRTTISWVGIEEATAYEIQRSMASDGPWTSLRFVGPDVASIAFSDSEGLGGHFRVIAYQASGRASPPSAPAPSRPGSFQVWKLFKGMAADAPADSDDDDDGIPLLLEYAFDLEPKQFSTLEVNRLFLGDRGQFPTVLQPDVAYSIERSQDGLEWERQPLFQRGDAGLSINPSIQYPSDDGRVVARIHCELVR